MYADLHTHSRYSDGMHTPAQLVEAAKAAGVSLLSVTDHNEIGAWPTAREAAARLGVSLIDGVEIDALLGGADIHILAYGASERDAAFARAVRYARERLDGMSAELVRRMERAGTPARLSNYNTYPDDRSRGGWKALYYLAECGACDSPDAALALYGKFDVTYAEAGFESAECVIGAIRGAGGFAVLAHPGVVAEWTAEEAPRRIEELFEMGMDGVECFYPKHSPEATERYLALCRLRGKLVTSGSDCHGSFSGKPVGFLRTPVGDLRLGALSAKITPPSGYPAAPK